MPEALPRIASTTALLAWFFGVLVVAHAVLAFTPAFHNRRTAFAIEYGWLAVAALGLIGSIGQTRMYLAGSLTRFDTPFLASTIEQARHDAADAESLFVRRYDYDRWRYSREQIPRFRAAGAWSARLGRLLQDSLTDAVRDSLARMAAEPAAGEPPTVRGVKEDLQREVHDVLAVAREIDRLESASHRSDAEDLLFLVSPWLLAAAVALRITKTSGDVRGWFAPPAADAREPAATGSDTPPAGGGAEAAAEEPGSPS